MEHVRGGADYAGERHRSGNSGWVIDLSLDHGSAPTVRVALTGGIATGKSYCLAKFAELGAPVIDADVLARQVVAPGTGALEAVVTRFGTAMLLADGTL